jgi:hypothetical protein
MHTRIFFVTKASVLFWSLFLIRPAGAAPADRYLHIQFWDTNKNAFTVNVSLPLPGAEKTLLTLDRGPLREGRVTVNNDQIRDIDVLAIIDATRNSPENQLVTVKQKGETIGVARSHANISFNVGSSKAGALAPTEMVGVMGSITAVKALFSGAQKNELDVSAALQPLRNNDTFVVSVQDATENVRVWVDSNSQPQ